MKTLFNILALCLLMTDAYSQTTYSVSNHALGGAQHADLWSAFAVAEVDDILLVEGTPTPHHSSHPTITWNKRLTAIGQGINTQKQGFETTKFSYAGYGFAFTIEGAASGSKFYGIDFRPPGNIALTNVSNLVFEDCIFRSPVIGAGNNVVFKNCVFQADIVIGIGGMNWLITNCVLDGQIIGANAPQSIIVDHCLFLSPGGCFSAVEEAEVKNSIFMNSTGITGVTNCNFQNNLARLDIDGDGDTESYFSPPQGNNDIGGNIDGTDPMMVNYPFGTLYSPLHDYHLEEGSPAFADSSGDLSLQIGNHGGFTHFSETFEPLVTPVIRSMNVVNTTVSPGGTLNVHVVASKPFSN